MTDTTPRTSFWDRATVGKTVLLVVVYLAFYLAVGQVVARLLGSQIDDDNVVASAASIIVGLALPIAIGGAALVLFLAKVGWLRDIFGSQPIRGRGWMWIGPVLVATAIVAHAAGTDWSDWSAAQLAALVVFGVCVGFTEELITRGVAVKMLRDAGRPEIFVALVSSLLFALMHTVNILAGMSLSVVGVTVLYTFAFGMCMYLAMRVTGTIWAAIVLHALTDPTTILSTGGLDEAVTSQSSGASALASVATSLLIVFGVLAVLFVRGKVARPGA